MTYQWPAEEGDANALNSFADDLSLALEEQGHCTIRLLDAPEAPQQAAARLSESIGELFQPPPPTFASAYLGTNRSSDVASFNVDAFDDPFVSCCMDQLDAVTHLLEPWMVHSMRFVPDLPCSKTIFRSRRRERSQGAVESDAANVNHHILSKNEAVPSVGAVADFLQWTSRRRLCLFLFVDVSGPITLKSKKPLEKEDILLEPAPNTLLILQHDRFTHTYEPCPGDLVLQTWVLEKGNELMLQRVLGEGVHRDDVQGMLPEVSSNVQCPLQVTGAAVRGNAYADINQLWIALGNCLDQIRDTPRTRWDWDEVLADVPLIDDWGISKHAAFLDNETLVSFDAACFGATQAEVYAWHPLKRITMEVGYECLVSAGWSRQSLQGASINIVAGHGGYDGEFVKYGEQWTVEAWNGSSKVQEAARLSRVFGFVGSVQSIDTACSTSNVAMNVSHQSLMAAAESGEGAQSSIIIGGTAHTDPNVFIGLSMAHMLTAKGRSRTFDNSASGFVRSEGANSCFVRTLHEQSPNTEVPCYATLVSTSCNQDGRSASLTAPNGPSQTACIKTCMRQGGLGPDSVIKFECHGTGTALGDPIEVSSCRTVMKNRELPLVQCSGKSNHGHMEIAAGAQGFLKTFMEIGFCASASNCHLRVLNFNMDVSGYPILHPIEITPLDGDGPESICGVSSFGFGGTNAHAIFGGHPHRKVTATGHQKKMATSNHKKEMAVGNDGGRETERLHLEKLDYITLQCPRCLGLKCWLCGIAVPKTAPQGKHQCASVREDTSSYELCSNCYDGKYVLQAPSYADVRDPGLPVYVRGSWSGYRTLEEMLWVPSRTSGHYEYSITLGEARQEWFQMVVDKQLTSLLYPTQGDAGQHVHIDGPDADGAGKFWLIDGICDNAPAGAKYDIRFVWGRSRRCIEWKLAAV